MTFEEWIENEGWLLNGIGVYVKGEKLSSSSHVTWCASEKDLRRDYKKYCKKHNIGTEPKEE